MYINLRNEVSLWQPERGHKAMSWGWDCGTDRLQTWRIVMRVDVLNFRWRVFCHGLVRLM